MMDFCFWSTGVFKTWFNNFSGWFRALISLAKFWIVYQVNLKMTCFSNALLHNLFTCIACIVSKGKKCFSNSPREKEEGPRGQ